MNILWSILWILFLIFLLWWVANLVAWLYILLLPFIACVPALRPFTDLLLKIVQYPYQAGINIRDGKQGRIICAVPMCTLGILEQVRKRWFLFGIVLVISLANVFPPLGAKGGPLRPEITVKYCAVSLIFFISGMSLKSEELTKAITQVRLHLFIQSYTLLFIPLAVTFLVKGLALTSFIDHAYLSGLHVVGCMPPPVSSAVLLTKNVGGNVAAAIFNSAFGSFLGIIVTPVLLLTLVGTTATVPFVSVFTQLSMTVLLPLLIGQIVRHFVKDWLEEKSPPFGTIGSCILLLIIYTTFCDTFQSPQPPVAVMSVINVIIVVILCQCTFLSVAFLIGNSFNVFSRQDIIAVLFCSTHKSLTLGIPILKIVFHDSDDLSSMTLPLLIYHPTQILLGSALVPFLQSWVQGDSGSTGQTSISSRASTPLKEAA